MTMHVVVSMVDDLPATSWWAQNHWAGVEAGISRYPTLTYAGGPKYLAPWVSPQYPQHLGRPGASSKGRINSPNITVIDNYPLAVEQR